MRHENKTSPGLDGKLIVLFRSLRERFKPVMRHFFTEKHKTPMSWFAMRLNYTRSVATTSIVGHILGLGDRHTSNILIESSTGEVVHIDLGIAFEQVFFFWPSFPCYCLTNVAIQGKATPSLRVSPVPHDGGHGRRHGHNRHARGFPALCRGNLARTTQRLRGGPHGSPGVQIRPTSFLVRPSLNLDSSCAPSRSAVSPSSPFLRVP